LPPLSPSGTFGAFMKNERLGCLGILLVVVLAVSLLLNFVFIASNTARTASSFVAAGSPKFEESTVTEARPTKGAKAADTKIALLSLRGIITSDLLGALGETMVEDLKLQLEQALEDAKVKAIVLHIDSPGGEVTASDVIYDAVRKAREKKPVVVSMGALAASGGYYVACGGSHIVAHDTTFTGSIGVIMQGINYEQLFGKVGLQMMTFKSGKYKDILSGSRPMTEEEKNYIQGLVMQTYDKFVGIVAKERNLPEEQLRNGVADGRVLSGRDALAAGLVNQLGSLEDAYAKAMELGNAPGSRIIRYDSPFHLGRLFRLLGQSEATKVEVNVAEALRPRLEMGRLYYLPSFYAP
jgi:protease-4